MTEIKKVEVQQPIISTNINSNSTVQLPHINIGQNADIDISNRAVELGITVDQYNELCEKDETFKFADINYQKRIVEQYIKPAEVATPTNLSSGEQASSQTLSASIASDEFVVQNLQEQAGQVEVEPEGPIDDVQRTENYDFKAFNELSGSEKLKVIIVELARNDYLYGGENNKRTPEDWENLPEDEKNALIYETEELFFEENKEAFQRKLALLQKSENNSPETINEFLANNALHHLETVLLANWLGNSVDEYEKITFDERVAVFNDAYSLDRHPENLTASQIKRLEANRDLTRAWGYFLATEGNQPDNAYWWCAQNGKNDALGLGCLKEQIAAYNEKNGTSIDIFDISEKYMKYQLDNNLVPITEREKFQEKYDGLVAYNKSSLKVLVNTKNIEELIAEGDVKISDPPMLGEMKNVFGYKEDSTFAQKQEVIATYLDQKLRGVSSPAEQADVIVGLMYELVKENSDNGMLVRMLHRNAVCVGGEALQTELAARLDAFSRAANAGNIDAYGNNTEALERIQQDQLKEISSADPEAREFAERLTQETMDRATVEQNRVLSKEYAGCDSEVVQNHHVVTAYRINRENPENGNIVAEMLNNTALYSTDEVRANATERVGELSAEHETPVLTALTKDCSLATQRAIEKDVASTLDVRNQADAVKLLRDNVQTQMSGEDVDKYLTTLADNIHNLDKSVQQDALNHIYESGNQSAINKALENLIDFTKTPVVLQEAETPRLFEEIIVKTALNDADLAGLNLTQQLEQSY